VVLWSVPAAVTDGSDIRRGGEIAAGRYVICHGADGESAGPLFPRLAGQHAVYLARELADFAGGRRRSATMAREAQDLSPADLRALGAYFGSRRAPSPALEALPGAIVAGREIFERGRPAAGVPACVSCHGPRGHGTAQLRQFDRRPATAGSAGMHVIAAKLGDSDAHAVAEFIATLD
jgi:cytochrome c553